MNHSPVPDDIRDEALSALYQATRERVEPPAWLDQQILAAARGAIDLRPVATKRWRFPAFRFWATPVAVAATILLAVGLAPLMEQNLRQEASPTPMKAQSLPAPAAELDVAPPVRLESSAADRALPAAPPPAPPAEPALTKRQLPALREAAPATVNEEATTEWDPVDRSAEEWLAEIAELRRQGRTAEADARLAEFQRHYPEDQRGIRPSSASPSP
jgi:hypothetical protein